MHEGIVRFIHRQNIVDLLAKIEVESEEETLATLRLILGEERVLLATAMGRRSIL